MIPCEYVNIGDPDAPFHVTADIAIFATVCLFDAMLHQVLDALRARYINNHHALRPETVKLIYGQVEKYSLLHHVTQIGFFSICGGLGDIRNL